MSVTLLEIIAAAEARRAPVVGEIAGYLVLAVADQLHGAPRSIDPEDLVLSEDGSIRITRGEAVTPDQAEAALRTLLGALLEVASSGAPALSRASRRKSRGGLEGLIREIEAGLIPVNRAAGKRAMARLVRETLRAIDRGGLDLEAARELVASRLPSRAAAPAPSPSALPVAAAPRPSAPSAPLPAVPSAPIASEAQALEPPLPSVAVSSTGMASCVPAPSPAHELSVAPAPVAPDPAELEAPPPEPPPSVPAQPVLEESAAQEAVEFIDADLDVELFSEPEASEAPGEATVEPEPEPLEEDAIVELEPSPVAIAEPELQADAVEPEAPGEAAGEPEPKSEAVVEPEPCEPSSQGLEALQMPDQTPPHQAVTKPDAPRVISAAGPAPTPLLGTLLSERPASPEPPFAVCSAPVEAPLDYREADATERMPAVATIDGALPDELPESFGAETPEPRPPVQVVTEKLPEVEVAVASPPDEPEAAPPEMSSPVASTPPEEAETASTEDQPPEETETAPTDDQPPDEDGPPAEIASVSAPPAETEPALESAPSPETDDGVEDGASDIPAPAIPFTPSDAVPVSERTPLGPEAFLRPQPYRAPFSSEAPPSIPERQSDVADLVARFAVTENESGSELGRELKKMAGLEPTPPPPGALSATPPPVVNLSDGPDRGDESPDRVPRAAILGIVGALALAVGGARALEGSASAPSGAEPAAAAATVAPAPEPECAATLAVVGAEEKAEIRVRGAQTATLRTGSGPEATFADLPCRRPLEVTVSDSEVGGWRRIPVSAADLTPRGDQRSPPKVTVHAR